MKYISLELFQKTCGLSDRAMMLLLREDKLDCRIENGTIEIDIDQVEIKELMASIRKGVQQNLLKNQAFISERIGSIVTTRLEKIFEKALSLGMGLK